MTSLPPLHPDQVEDAAEVASEAEVIANTVAAGEALADALSLSDRPELQRIAAEMRGQLQ